MAPFSEEGKTPAANEALVNLHRNGTKIVERRLTTHVGIGSREQDLALKSFNTREASWLPSEKSLRVISYSIVKSLVIPCTLLYP